MKIRAFSKSIQDIRDPVAVHLFYEQVKADVIQGEIPVTETEFLELLGFQLQALLSDNDPKIHKSGYFKYLTFVFQIPAEIYQPQSKPKDPWKELYHKIY